jgi:YgiT-type zinc finger domain-containing protein
MKCVICKLGETEYGTATVTLERDGLTLVVKKVPARVCRNCGEEYIDEVVAEQLFKTVEEVAGSGAEVDVRHYRIAA